jgi:hypothetical protein
MSVDLNFPQNLLQYKEYIVAKQGDIDFFFVFKNLDDEVHTIFRVFKNEYLLNEKDYNIMIFNGEGVSIILNDPCEENDTIHLDIFMPLKRFNEFSICISHDFTIECDDNKMNYPFEFEDYSPISCKLNIIHSRLGFIPKTKYTVLNDEINFNNVEFKSGDVLFIKIIQDGGILLQ